MNTWNKNIIRLATVAAVAMFVASCDHKQLYYADPFEEPEMQVLFDWSKSPEAAPKGMRIWFFGTDSDFRECWDLGSLGGKVELKEAEYNALAINNDTEWVEFVNSGNFFSFRASTRTGGLYEPITGSQSTAVCPESGEPVAVPPEPIWGVGEVSHQLSDGSTLVLQPEPLYCTYTVEFRNIRDLDKIRSMSASLSGLARSVTVADGSLSDECCTVPFEASKGEDGVSIIGTFCTFGHNPLNDAPHHAALYLELANGSYIQYTQGDWLDVTDQVHSAADPRNVHIVVETPGIPADDNPPSSSGGMDTTAEDWQGEEHEVRI